MLSDGRNFSGILVNQNSGTAPQNNTTGGPVSLPLMFTGATPYVTFSQAAGTSLPLLLSGTYPSSAFYQTFYLPKDFIRGSDVGEIIPNLTGLQVAMGIDPGTAAQATIAYELDHYITGTGWTTLVTGETVGVHHDGNLIWVNLFFDKPVEINSTWVTDEFRLKIAGTNGASHLWFSSPNPLGATANQMFDSSGTNPVIYAGGGVSMRFRVLGDIADSGIDFLGNTYRSALVKSAVSAVSTVNGDPNSYWLSKPNPSQFAVENLYFDVSQNGASSVIDTILLDPLTTGVNFHVYGSNDPQGPGVDDPSWENLLWTPVHSTFTMGSKETYALPDPLNAKYVKIEFSNLQARYYAPGNAPASILYKRFPHWVTAYFLAFYQVGDFTSNSLNLVYDALDLAFNYYTGDITQTPRSPDVRNPAQFAQQLSNLSNSGVDSSTLAAIKMAFRPFLDQPGLQQNSGLLGQAVAAKAAQSNNYPTEVISRSVADTSPVSSLNREQALLEKTYPTMFFYLPARHGYREAYAQFQNDIGYYAGVKSVAFARSRYTTQADDALYNESASDNVNVEANDFILDHDTWVTYSTDGTT